jgi:hypothetical protein
MSDRSRGAARVRSVERRLHEHGYRTAIVSASGQRRGARHDSLALDGDIVGLAPDGSGWPHIVAEIGGRSKSVRESLREMRQHGLPAGFTPIVVRLVDSSRKRWRWHLDSDVAFDTLDDLLDALSSA